MLFIPEIKETGKPTTRHPIVTSILRFGARDHPGSIFGERLHPLVRWITMRIKKRVRQPSLPKKAPRGRLGINRVRIPLPIGKIGSQRGMVAGMQHEIRGDMSEVNRKLSPIDVGNRMN